MITRERKRSMQSVVTREIARAKHDAQMQKRLDIIGMDLEIFRSQSRVRQSEIWDMVEMKEGKA